MYMYVFYFLKKLKSKKKKVRYSLKGEYRHDQQRMESEFCY